jgi:hypothetical protein
VRFALAGGRWELGLVENSTAGGGAALYSNAPACAKLSALCTWRVADGQSHSPQSTPWGAGVAAADTDHSTGRLKTLRDTPQSPVSVVRPKYKQ